MAGSKKNQKNQKIKKKSTQTKKVPTLKQKLHRESKVVKVDNLKWKKVEIPDTLDDFEGFYGLEEIDGVDVQIENGVTKFIVKGEEEGDEEEGDVDVDVDDEEDVEDEDAEDEFSGFEADDVSVSEEQKSTQKKEENNTKDTKDSKDSKKKKQAKTSKDTKDVDAQGSSNAFDIDLEAIGNTDVDLPEWNDLNLSSYTLTGLSALEFNTPTEIQRETIPLALSELKDVIGKASTGSGKTLAYGIPILERYLQQLPAIEQARSQKKTPSPTGIIFAPTRELAHQVVDHLNKLAQFSPLLQHGIVSVTGGLSIQKQERLLLHGPGIIVATPGRFLELLQKDEELIKRLALTEFIVLDEADRLLQDGHFEEFEKILELFHKNRPKREGHPWKWQTLVFSATFAKDLFYKLDTQKSFKKPEVKESAEEKNTEIVKLLHDKLRFKDSKPAYIDKNPNDKVSDAISEALVECGATERDLYLYYFLLMYPGSTLVFANAIDSVKRLVPLLNNLNIPAFSIHSSMVQKQRLRAIERFTEATQKSKTAVLIASDVAARGLDIPNIDHVAHYHLPRSADVYIHRSGRTARAGKEGVSVMFCSPQELSGPLRKLRKAIADSSNKKYKKINAHQDVKLLPVDMDIITQLKPRITIASKLADNDVASTSTRKEDSWVNQAAEDLGIDDLDDIANFDDDILKRMRKRKENKLLEKDDSKAMKYELKQLLNEKLRKNARRSYITSGLQNLAHQMVSGNMHNEVLGHAKINALDDIRKKPKVVAKKAAKKAAPSKVTKPKESKNNNKKGKAKNIGKK